MSATKTEMPDFRCECALGPELLATGSIGVPHWYLDKRGVSDLRCRTLADEEDGLCEECRGGHSYGPWLNNGNGQTE